MSTIDQLERRVRRLRQAIAATPSFQEDLPVTAEDVSLQNDLQATLAQLRDARAGVPKVVGVYSGLARSELARTGTCETDWF